MTNGNRRGSQIWSRPFPIMSETIFWVSGPNLRLPRTPEETPFLMKRQAPPCYVKLSHGTPYILKRIKITFLFMLPRITPTSFSNRIKTSRVRHSASRQSESHLYYIFFQGVRGDTLPYRAPGTTVLYKMSHELGQISPRSKNTILLRVLLHASTISSQQESPTEFDT